LDAVVKIILNSATDAKLFSDDEIYEHQVIQVHFLDKSGFVVGTVHEAKSFKELNKCVVNNFVVPIQGLSDLHFPQSDITVMISIKIKWACEVGSME